MGEGGDRPKSRRWRDPGEAGSPDRSFERNIKINNISTVIVIIVGQVPWYAFVVTAVRFRVIARPIRSGKRTFVRVNTRRDGR